MAPGIRSRLARQSFVTRRRSSFPRTPTCFDSWTPFHTVSNGWNRIKVATISSLLICIGHTMRSFARTLPRVRSNTDRIMNMARQIPHQWLRQKGTPQDFERARLERTAAAFHIPLEVVDRNFANRPFGEMTDAWRAFLAKMVPDDELWSFSSPDSTFAKKLGCTGFAIVRAGAIVDTFVTLRT